MAGAKVQGYLERHKIGPLFEKLMAAVIKEMPYDPLHFLVEHLQKYADKQSSGLSSKNVARSWSAKSAQDNFGLTGKTVSRGAKVSKSTDGQSGSPRDYAKPWQASGKTSSSSDHTGVGVSPRRPQSGGISPRQTQSGIGSPRRPLSGGTSPRTNVGERPSPRKSTTGWKHSGATDKKQLNTVEYRQANTMDYEDEITKESSAMLNGGKTGHKHGLGDDKQVSAIKTSEELLRAAKQRKATSANRKAELKNLLTGNDSQMENNNENDASKRLKEIERPDHVEDLIDETEMEASSAAQTKEDNISIRICATCAKLMTGDGGFAGRNLRDFASEAGMTDTFSVYSQGRAETASQVSQSTRAGSPSAVQFQMGAARDAASIVAEDETIETLFGAQTHHSQQYQEHEVQSVADEQSEIEAMPTYRTPAKNTKEAWGYKDDDSETD